MILRPRSLRERMLDAHGRKGKFCELVDPYRYAVGGGGGSDPDFASRILIAPFTEDPVLDYSPLGRTLTQSGSIAISTSDPTFPAGVAVFTGTNGKLTAPHDTLDDFGTNAVMTGEGWAWTASYPSSGNIRILWGTRAATGPDNGMLCFLDDAGQLHFIAYAAGVQQFSSTVPFSVPLSTWFNWAIAFNGAAGGLIFIDGAIKITATGVPLSPGSTNGDLVIGSASNEGGTRNWLGVQTMVRFSNGVCQYTTTYTPPTSYPLS